MLEDLLYHFLFHDHGDHSHLSSAPSALLHV